MAASAADVLIQDLEDFTPPQRRAEARALIPALYAAWRAAGKQVAVRINRLGAEHPGDRQGEGEHDLAAALPHQPDYVLYPKAATARDMQQLDAALARHEQALGQPVGSTRVVPVCETALGVVTVREMAAASPRVSHALLGAEDLAADLLAELSPEAVELDHARRRFVLECRAAGIEPIDAPYTFGDAAGAAAEAAYARRLGYRCKSAVRPDHSADLQRALRSTDEQIARARLIDRAFVAARERGEDRVLVDGLWVEVPTWLNARRLLAEVDSAA